MGFNSGFKGLIPLRGVLEKSVVASSVKKSPAFYESCVHNSSVIYPVQSQMNSTFLLLPTWYTNFLLIHINYIKLNSSTCFERNPPIIRRSTTQIVHMQPLVSSLSASDRLVQPLRKDGQPNIQMNSVHIFTSSLFKTNSALFSLLCLSVQGGLIL